MATQLGMKATIDPRLLEKIEAAGDEGQVEAVVLVADDAAAGSADERGAGGRLLDRVTRRLKQQPAHVRFMPKLGAVVVRGSGKLVRQLLEDDDVVSASANDAEITKS